MSQKDYYELLEVSRNAGTDEIKKSYKRLALKYHPDRNKGDKQAEEKFKEITSAYEVLSDPNKKAAYDRCGHESGSGGFDFSQGFSSSADFSDIFSEFFGGSFGGRRTRSTASRGEPGADLRYDIEIKLEDAYNEMQVPVSYVTNTKCDTCHGTGSEGAVKPVRCHACQGSGRTRSQQGFFTVERTCNACYGEGETIQNKCKKCGGNGRRREEVKVLVAIPKGVETGSKVKVNGKGEAGIRGGKDGDLYVYVKIASHKTFAREKSDLHCTIPIKMITAVLGGEIEVSSVDGTKLKVNVQPGTQSDTKLRLKNKGMPLTHGSNLYGDMYVKVKVETPTNLNDKQVRLLKEAFDVNQHEPNGGLFHKVKKK